MMRFNLKMYFILFLAVVLFECHTDTRRKAFESYYQYYVFFENIDRNLVSHMPKKFDYNTAYFIGGKTSKDSKSFGNYLHLVLMDSINNDRFFKEDFNFKYKINSLDSCNLIVPWFSAETHSKEDFAHHLDSLLKRCSILSYPVPNFSYEASLLGQEDNKLPRDFAIYVIELESKSIVEDYLSRGYGLPDAWKEGYSKGVAISKDRGIVIFWIEAW